MKHLIFIILVTVFSTYSFSQINNDHLDIGEKAPSIIGVDQFDQAINSAEVLKDQKVLLVFYRGNWCPHCRKHLASLQENLETLTKKGLFVIVPRTAPNLNDLRRWYRSEDNEDLVKLEAYCYQNAKKIDFLRVFYTGSNRAKTIQLF